MSVKVTDEGWILETRNTGYAIGVDDGRVTHRYWGSKLPFDTDYPAPVGRGFAGISFYSSTHFAREEYPAQRGIRYDEACLQAVFDDSVRDIVLAFQTSHAGDDTLEIVLEDTHYHLLVTLHYRVHEAYDLIERWATIKNDGPASATLETVFSAQWHMPDGDGYRMTQLSGRWAGEDRLVRTPLTHGKHTLESRRITPGHDHSPWFAVDRGDAGEETGDVWFGALAWSGAWKIVAETNDFSQTRVIAGVNDWDFAWLLRPGEEFTTPSSVGGYSAEGFGQASRALHDYVRERVLPHSPALHKVIYNSWEATTFHIDEPSQIALAEHAASLGVELFVVDDGWFHNRNHDRAGLGDWTPDEVKFPNGLGGLIARVKDLGMQFGLWIEPEMVNPDSDLYRAHPDWIIHFPTREPSLGRNQCILNLARPDVQDHLIGVVDKLLTENDIAFIKWDMNRSVSEPGWEGSPGDARELWVRYVQGVYRLWGTLRERHPSVIWQSCSGGGGRADLGILRYADQVWVSDNTDATARLEIQEGFSYVLPAITMESWVTDWARSIPLAFRFHVCMCGALGVGCDIREWKDADDTLAGEMIALYKQIRPVVQLGDLYRLRSPHESPFSALQYVGKDRSEAVLFAFRTHINRIVDLPPVYLRGLDPAARYTVEGFDGQRSGASLMHAGLRIPLSNFESTIRRIRRLK